MLWALIEELSFLAEKERWNLGSGDRGTSRAPEEQRWWALSHGWEVPVWLRIELMLKGTVWKPMAPKSIGQ